MAFFGGGLFNDPFMRQTQHMMQRQMDEMLMMGSMMDPFSPLMGLPSHSRLPGGNPRELMIDDGRIDHRGRQQQQFQRSRPPDALMPFGMGLLGGGLFGGVNQMFGQMEQLQNRVATDPNSHMFTHSQVISYSNLNGRPEYYETSNSIRKAGEVKEVRKTVRDSRHGVEKMSIGHHIGDKGHVIEKQRGRDGRILENQEFHNLHEGEAHQFDREWSSRTQQPSGSRRLALEERSDRREERRSSPYLSRRKDKSGKRDKDKEEEYKGPIIEEIE